MKVVIFADRSYNYVKPISTGLYSTLKDMGVDVEIWYDGVYWLIKQNLSKVLLADIYRMFLNIHSKNSKLYLYRFWNLFTFYSQRRKKALNECDCIIVVQNCPSCFDDDNLKRLDFIRETYKKPLVNYDFHYLPNQGWWSRIKQFSKCKGLEQFDWYLPIGLITEYAIPNTIPQIYNCIGMDINSPELYPEQKEFTVLLDFPRSEHDEQRDRMKRVLDEMSITWIELNGRYTTSQIRSIYRKCSLYVVSTRESFGLPIVELQLCGAKILTPFKEWVPAHYLNKSPFDKGIGNLGRNFLVFNNNDETLKSILAKELESIDYKLNIKKFEEDYPGYYKINKEELEKFLNKVKVGEIRNDTHLLYKQYNTLISDTDNFSIADEQYK